MSRRYLLAAAVLSLTVSRVGLADPLVHTYSIVARDPATGEMGVAVQSHWFSVGSIVTWVEAGVGAARGGAACLRGGLGASRRGGAARVRSPRGEHSLRSSGVLLSS